MSTSAPPAGGERTARLQSLYSQGSGLITSVLTTLLAFLVAGLVTMLVGAVGIMNIMLVVVGERRAEIGLRKAVGARSRTIFLQFLAESTAVCGLAGIAGTLLGVGATQLVAHLMPENSPLASVPILDPTTVIIPATVLILTGIVAGTGPAWRASRVPPAEALRIL